MSYLRQSTASQVRAIGPFVDSTDLSAETALTVTNTEVNLIKNGGTSGTKSDTSSLTHRSNGVYNITFNATDTDTVGELEVVIAETGALIVRKSFWVLEEVVYDALFAANATILTSKDVGLLYESTISTVNSQTSFDMADSINTDNNWNGNEAIIEDATNGDTNTVRISDVDQANNRIIIDSGDTTFTVAATDIIRVFSRKHPRAALEDYDPPTRTEATNDKNEVLDRQVAMAQLMTRSDAAIKADRSSELSLINNDEGTGVGDYDNETDSMEKVGDGVNVTKMNNATVTGTGTSGDKWRGV